MAEMVEVDRRGVWVETMQELSRAGESIGITKAELRAAVDAVDTWLNSNASTLNAALPQPARGTLTTAQKARLLQYVVARRYLAGV